MKSRLAAVIGRGQTCQNVNGLTFELCTRTFFQVFHNTRALASELHSTGIATRHHSHAGRVSAIICIVHNMHTHVNAHATPIYSLSVK